MKKINWKLRLQNKATLLTLATVLVTAAYGVLAALGIVVDPTTAGMADSTRAMGYDEPRGGDGR